MIIKDSRQYYSKNIMSYTTFITFWIVALLCTSSSGFPQGNLESESNSTTASPTTTNEMNISTTDANESTVSDTSETPISLSANDTTTTLTTEPSTSDGNSTLPETTSTIPTTLEETTEDTTTDTTEAETTETLSTTPLSPLQDTSLVFNSSQEAIATVSESMSNGISATTEVDEKFEDLQYQIYILSGTFGIISLLLIILVIVLVTSISRLRDQVISTRHVPYIPDNRTGGDQIHAYDNSAFSSGHEMQERRRSNLDKEAQKQGYGTQNGNNSPYERQNEAESSQNKQSGDRDSKSTLMRYEDGVIPFHNDSTPNGSMKRSHQHNS